MYGAMIESFVHLLYYCYHSILADTTILWTVCTVANGSVCVYRRGSVYPTSKISTCVLMFKGSFVDNVPVSSMLLHSPNNTCVTVVASGQLSFQDTLCLDSGQLPLKTLFDLNPVLKINFITVAHHVV